MKRSAKVRRCAVVRRLRLCVRVRGSPVEAPCEGEVPRGRLAARGRGCGFGRGTTLWMVMMMGMMQMQMFLGGLLTRACEACEWCLETGSCSFLEVKRQMLKGRGMGIWSCELSEPLLRTTGFSSGERERERETHMAGHLALPTGKSSWTPP